MPRPASIFYFIFLYSTKFITTIFRSDRPTPRPRGAQIAAMRDMQIPVATVLPAHCARFVAHAHLTYGRPGQSAATLCYTPIVDCSLIPCNILYIPPNIFILT